MKKQLLIVDGYNMIGSWPELVQLKKQDKMADAREALLHRLSNYAKYEGLEVIVVFDAQLVPGIQQNYRKYQLDVVFTKEDEQWMIFSQGALRTSAYELYKTIKKTEKTIAQENKDMHFVDFRRNSPWNEEQLKKLSQKLDDLMRKNK